MSGPKVVRIVTVEEVHQICRGHLARLDAAVARWEKTCRRNDAVTESDVKAIRERVAEIAALMTKERYLDLQKRVPEEIQWLETDAERRLEEVARRVAEANLRARRRSTLAKQLLQRTTLSATVRQDLEGIARGDATDPQHAETIIGEALRSTMPSAINDANNALLKALAERLADGQKGETLDEWLAANGGDSNGDAAGDKMETAIAALSMAGAAQEAATLAGRYKALLTEPASGARKMKADTLLIEVGRTFERHSGRVRQLAELEQTLAEARSALDAAGSSLISEAEDVLSREDAAAAVTVSKRLADAIDVRRKTEAAAARRRAVLAALAEVGYEAREGMDTAEPSGGNLVFRRATNPEMGVEISGGTASSRLQLRPVRFAAAGTPSDANKDRDIETVWCSDFDSLRDGLRKLNADIAIERATPVGSTPVMVVHEESTTDGRRTLGLPLNQTRRN